MYFCLFSFNSIYNAASYTASVKLLATLTNYQYTRRAWQKDAYDLFLDANFFRMGSSSISGLATRLFFDIYCFQRNSLKTETVVNFFYEI